MSEKHEIVLEGRDEKKHSTRWDYTGPTPSEGKPLVNSIYINKPFLTGAKKVKITIEAVE